MSIEFLTELENKVETLIATLERVRQENAQLKQDLEITTGKFSASESENSNLRSELEALKEDSQGREQKMNATAERIQGLLAKLEAVAN